MELREAVERALDGDALLFVGSGFSLGAVNSNSQPFKTASELAAHFAQLSGLSEDRLTLEDAAETFAEKLGPDQLISEIQTEYTAREVTSWHRELATIPWKRIYTTNYDNVVETSYQLEGIRITPVTTGADIYKIPKDHTICVHLNGFVNTLDRHKIWTELKLTETSYITASLAESPWAILFRQDIRLAKSVFFLGYSLYDLDIKRILHETHSLKSKCFFVLGPSPDGATRRRASRFGIVVDISVEDFMQTVKQLAESYVPIERTDFSTVSIKEHAPVSVSAPITDRAFIDLLLFGNSTAGQISESLRSGKKYYLERGAINRLFEHIDNGSRVITICSNLGNGKTLLLDGVHLRALERGFRVFEVQEHNEGVDAELETIAKLQEKVLVTIEEYQNWLDEIRSFRLNAGDQAVLVLTARSAVHDVVLDDLLRVAAIDAVPEIYLDGLDDHEVKWFLEVLDEFGLWGDQAGLGRYRKIKYLKERCGSEIHAILLKVLSSPDISERLRKLSDAFKADTDIYQVLLTIFIMRVLNYPPTVDVLADVWGTQLLNSSRFRKHPAVREFIDLRHGRVLLRSPVVAQHMLRNVADTGSILSALTTMAKRADLGARVSWRYRDLSKTLMRFSSLQLLLPDEGRGGAVIRYYESIKNMRSCKHNTLFWLQYAIACLFIHDLLRSRKYFDTAYALAEGREWNTFQIDNHFARYLLVEAIEKLPASKAMGNFRQAKAIISRQMNNERLHYPYRVAIVYREILDKFGAQLSLPEIEEVAGCATDVLKRIGQLSDFRQRHKYVVECRKAMTYIVARAHEFAVSLEAAAGS